MIAQLGDHVKLLRLWATEADLAGRRRLRLPPHTIATGINPGFVRLVRAEGGSPALRTFSPIDLLRTNTVGDPTVLSLQVTGTLTLADEKLGQQTEHRRSLSLVSAEVPVTACGQLPPTVRVARRRSPEPVR